MQAWPWRIASVVFAALAGVGIATSQGWIDPTANDPAGDLPTVPYTAPQVASFLPTDDDLSQLLGRSVLTLADGYPAARTYLSTSALARDTRIFNGLNTWERQWTSADGLTTATVILNGTASPDAVPSPQSLCGSQAESVASTIPDSEATIEVYTDTGEPYRYCALLDRPGFNASISIELPRDTTADQYRERGDGLLTAIIAARGTADLVGGTELNERGRIDLPSARTLIVRGWMLAFLALSALAVVPSLLRDRATWLRLLSRGFRAAPHPRQIDLAPAAALALSRARGFGWARFALNVWALRLSEELRLDGLWSGVLFAGAFLLGLLIEHVAAWRSGGHPGRSVYQVGGIVAVGVGAVFTIGIVIAALLVWDIGNAYTVGSALIPRANEADAVRFGVALEVLAAVILLPAYVPLMISRRLASRFRRPTRVGKAAPTVLYLRSFIDDDVTLRTHFAGGRGLLDRLAMRRRERFEQLAAFELGRYGRVIAVGRPDELLPPELGAVRLYFGHDEWQEKVAELSESSQSIAMTLGRTQGFIWELERLRDSGLLHKTLILVPPVSHGERSERLAVLARTLDIPHRVLQAAPAGHVVALRFPIGDSAPIAYISRAPDDLAYAAAVARSFRDDAGGPASDAEPMTESNEIDDESEAMLLDLEGPFQAEELTPEDTRAISAQRLLRRLALGGILAFTTVVGLVALMAWAFIPAEPPGTSVDRVAWNYGDIVALRSAANGIPVALVADDGSDDIVALQPSTLLPAGGPIPYLTGNYSDVVFGDGIAYVAFTASGTVVAVDLSDGSAKWTAEIHVGVRGLALSGSVLTAADPVGTAVVIIDVADGSSRNVAVDGMVWDTAIDGHTAHAVTLDTNRLVAVDLRSATVSADHPTLATPVAVAIWDGGVAVQSWVDHRVAVSAQLGNESATIATQLLAPTFAASGTLLAVEGPERVAIIDTAGTIYRIAKGTTVPTVMDVHDGVVTFFNDAGGTLVRVAVKQ